MQNTSNLGETVGVQPARTSKPAPDFLGPPSTPRRPRTHFLNLYVSAYVQSTGLSRKSMAGSWLRCSGVAKVYVRRQP